MSDRAVQATCRSRRHLQRCRRPVGHVGLHAHGGSMWSDASADPPRCPGSGEPAPPAPTVADGYPFGHALCTRCHGLVPLHDGRLAAHDTGDGLDDPRSRDWFNTFGW